MIPRLLDATTEQNLRNFFTERFEKEPESDPSYYIDWRNRAKKGQDVLKLYADSKSTELLKKHHLITK